MLLDLALDFTLCSIKFNDGRNISNLGCVALCSSIPHLQPIFSLFQMQRIIKSVTISSMSNTFISFVDLNSFFKKNHPIHITFFSNLFSEINCSEKADLSCGHAWFCLAFASNLCFSGGLVDILLHQTDTPSFECYPSVQKLCTYVHMHTFLCRCFGQLVHNICSLVQQLQTCPPSPAQIQLYTFKLTAEKYMAFPVKTHAPLSHTTNHQGFA